MRRSIPKSMKGIRCFFRMSCFLEEANAPDINDSDNIFNTAIHTYEEE